VRSVIYGREGCCFDADAYVLARAAEVLAQCYTPEVAPPLRIFFFCSSSPALQTVQNPRAVKAHTYSLRFHKVLTTFFSNHDNVHLVLCWAPKDDDLEGDRMARSLAATACQRSLADLPNGMDCILSAAYQKDRARRRAFHQWELDYHLARAHNDLQINTTGIPLDGAAYQYAISQPPSKKNHPVWSRWSLWKKTSGVVRHGVLFSRGGPPQLHYNWQLITLLPGLMRASSDCSTHPHLSHAHVATICVTLTTSSETVISTTSLAYPA
jgi:hypothetical protein